LDIIRADRVLVQPRNPESGGTLALGASIAAQMHHLIFADGAAQPSESLNSLILGRR